MINKTGNTTNIPGWGDVEESVLDLEKARREGIIDRLKEIKDYAEKYYISDKKYAPPSEQANTAISHIGAAIRNLEAMG